jgi:hypothetical protein
LTAGQILDQYNSIASTYSLTPIPQSLSFNGTQGQPLFVNGNTGDWALGTSGTIEWWEKISSTASSYYGNFNGGILVQGNQGTGLGANGIDIFAAGTTGTGINSNVGGNITTSGLTTSTTFNGTTLSVSGTVTGATSVATSGTVSATGNITGGNILTGGLVSATGNITGGNLVSSANVIVNGSYIKIPVASSDPAGGVNGAIYLNPTTGGFGGPGLRAYYNGTWYNV